MNKKITLSTLAIVGAVLMGLIIGGGSKALSANASTLVVSPPTFDLTANPGDTENESIKVENVSSKPISVATKVEDFVAVGTQGAVNLTTQSNHYSLTSWVDVTPSSVTIPAKSSTIFNVVINIPSNAEPGGKFGSIVFTTGSQKTSASTIAVAQQVGSLILLRIAGKADENATITSFTANTSVKGQQSTIEFSALIKDLGNVQVKPVGYISVNNMFNHKLITIPFDSKYVIPGASRQFPEYWHHGFLFGKYYANITLLYGTTNKIMSDSVSFWVIPWKLIIIVLAAVIVVGFLIWKVRRRIAKSIKILFGKE